MNRAIAGVLSLVHFNNKFPENHNIKMPNVREPYIQLMIDMMWVLKPIETQIPVIKKRQISTLLRNLNHKPERFGLSESEIINRKNELNNIDLKYNPKAYLEKTLIMEIKNQKLQKNNNII